MIRRLVYESMRPPEGSWASTWATYHPQPEEIQDPPMIRSSLEPVLNEYEIRTGEVDERFPTLVLRLVLWERSESCRNVYIRTVVEQEIWLGTGEDQSGVANGARIANFVAALKSAVIDVMEHLTLDQMENGPMMPYDFFKHSLSVLRLKTPGTTQEFAKAIRAKGRLGRYL